MSQTPDYSNSISWHSTADRFPQPLTWMSWLLEHTMWKRTLFYHDDCDSRKCRISNQLATSGSVCIDLVGLMSIVCWYLQAFPKTEMVAPPTPCFAKTKNEHLLVEYPWWCSRAETSFRPAAAQWHATLRKQPEWHVCLSGKQCSSTRCRPYSVVVTCCCYIGTPHDTSSHS